MNLALAASCAFGTSGCKEEENKPGGDAGSACDPEADTSDCLDGFSCESAPESETGNVCAVPLILRGMVIDAADESAIQDARVFAQNAEGAPVTDVETTDGDGNYELYVPIARDADGEIDPSSSVTLNASAAGYLAYPSGIRPAIPVSLLDPETTEDASGASVQAVENSTTTIVLVARDPSDTSGVSVAGEVVADDPGGALVIVDSGGVIRTGIADLSGDFRVFDVSQGTATIEGYKGGLALAPESREVADADITDVMLEAEEGLATGSVEGSVSIVNAPGGSGTSIVLIPKSVYDPVFERGAIPFGLRAPSPGTPPDINGGWLIEDVPPGTYMVLAAFENDGLVRDPDTSIAGTEVVEVTVSSGELVTLSTGFKVTAALAVESPGADLPELVTESPTFVFEDDSSEDYYQVVVYDAVGDIVWDANNIPGGSGGGPVEVPYAGEPLEPGMYYQFRATSIRDKNGTITPISRTEDLRGLFVYSP